jgi:hypothetical protein
MARIFSLSGAAILFVAFVLNLIVSISLPFLPALDVTRTHFQQVASDNGQGSISEIRVSPTLQPSAFTHILA